MSTMIANKTEAHSSSQFSRKGNGQHIGRGDLTTQIQRGFSLVEVMVSLTISLLISLAIATIFISSSKNEREFSKSQNKLSNVAYAMDSLRRDLWHVGYYGRFAPSINAAASMPDPCNTSTSNLQTGLALPLQVYWAPSWTASPDMSSTTCTLPDLMPGSDVVVIRRAHVWPMNSTTANPPTIQGIPYLASSSGSVTVVNGAVGLGATGTPFAGAEAYQYIHRIYYIGACSEPTGTNGTCQATDDGGVNAPSLRMMEISSVGGSRVFRNITVAEGVESMRIEVGVDMQPSEVNTLTQMIGDGDVDAYFPTAAERSAGISDGLVPNQNAVVARVFLLMRNATTTPGYVDRKSYVLGSSTRAAASDGYVRNLYEQTLRLANLAGRRVN